MSWNSINKLIGLALIDPDFCRELLDNPVAAAKTREIELTSQEQEVLNEIHVNDISEFSRIVLEKLAPDNSWDVLLCTLLWSAAGKHLHISNRRAGMSRGYSASSLPFLFIPPFHRQKYAASVLWLRTYAIYTVYIVKYAITSSTKLLCYETRWGDEYFSIHRLKGVAHDA